MPHKLLLMLFEGFVGNQWVHVMGYSKIDIVFFSFSNICLTVDGNCIKMKAITYLITLTLPLNITHNSLMLMKTSNAIIENVIIKTLDVRWLFLCFIICIDK